MKVHISGIAVSMAQKNQFDFTENGGKQTNETETAQSSVSLQTPLHVEPQQKEDISALLMTGLFGTRVPPHLCHSGRSWRRNERSTCRKLRAAVWKWGRRAKGGCGPLLPWQKTWWEISKCPQNKKGECGRKAHVCILHPVQPAELKVR